ncbi:unnamed protein product [Orchesella dallaii]|uniref:Uncharacterized protein n=1 Tax=Orchesella dallaii TaxID=48710 RepID=A0ABP1R5G9_9HEXA
MDIMFVEMKKEVFQLIQKFIKEFKQNPQDFADYGSDEWVFTLINRLKEAGQVGISVSLIRKWMRVSFIFAEVNRMYEYCPVTETSGCKAYVTVDNLPLADPEEVVSDEPSESVEPPRLDSDGNLTDTSQFNIKSGEYNKTPHRLPDVPIQVLDKTTSQVMDVDQDASRTPQPGHSSDHPNNKANNGGVKRKSLSE